MKQQYYDVDVLLDGTTTIDGKKKDIEIDYSLPLPEFVEVPSDIKDDELNDYVYKHSKWLLRGITHEYDENNVLTKCLATWTNATDNLSITEDIFSMPEGSYNLTVSIDDSSLLVREESTTQIELPEIQQMYRDNLLMAGLDSSTSFGSYFISSYNSKNDGYIKWLKNAYKHAKKINKEQIIVSKDEPDPFFYAYEWYLNKYLLANEKKLKEDQKQHKPIMVEIPFPHINKTEFDKHNDPMVIRAGANGKTYPDKLDISVLPKEYQNEIVTKFWNNTEAQDKDFDDTFGNQWRMLEAIYDQIGGFSVLSTTPNYDETEEHEDYDIMRVKIPYDRVKWSDDNKQ